MVLTERPGLAKSVAGSGPVLKSRVQFLLRYSENIDYCVNCPQLRVALQSLINHVIYMRFVMRWAVDASTIGAREVDLMVVRWRDNLVAPCRSVYRWFGMRVVLACVGLVVAACPGNSQSESPAVSHIGPSNDTGILRHRDFAGKPCLDVQGYSRPHTIAPNLYDHVITVLNSCPQRIPIRVCYYQSQDCISMEIPGGDRKEAILGTLPAIKEFRFEFREKF
jgi:hypothetical protein